MTPARYHVAPNGFLVRCSAPRASTERHRDHHERSSIELRPSARDPRTPLDASRGMFRAIPNYVARYGAMSGLISDGIRVERARCATRLRSTCGLHRTHFANAANDSRRTANVVEWIGRVGGSAPIRCVGVSTVALGSPNAATRIGPFGRADLGRRRTSSDRASCSPEQPSIESRTRDGASRTAITACRTTRARSDTTPTLLPSAI
jgi:hypothetical protein